MDSASRPKLFIVECRIWIECTKKGPSFLNYVPRQSSVSWNPQMALMKVFCTFGIVMHGAHLRDDLLVVQHYIWPPNVIGRNVKLFDTSILLGVPNQLVVIPKLFNPQIGSHDLVL